MTTESVSVAPSIARSPSPARRWARRLALPAACAGIAGSAVLGLALHRPPDPPLADGGTGTFSLTRAQRDVDQLAGRPHPNGSSGAAQARAYLAGELSRLQLAPVEQEVAHLARTGAGRQVWRSVRNVMARLEGRASRKALLVMAHYDSAAASPGASDNAVGVATVLETARALRSGATPANDVIFLFTDSEELGLSGARAFATGHAWARDVGVVLNFDARGTSGPSLMFETSPGNGWLIRQLARGTPWPRASSLYHEVYRLMGNDTDLSVFTRGLGVAGMNFAFVESPGRHHTSGDTAASVDRATMYQQGANAVSLVGHMAAVDLPARTEPDVVYLMIADRLIVYSQAWRWTLAVVMLLGLIALLWFAIHRHGVGSWMIARATLAGIVAVPVACVVAYGVRRLLQQLVPALDTPGLGLYANGFQQVGLVLVCLTAVLAVLGRLRRRATRAALVLGGAIVGALTAALLSALVPGASYVLVWPSLVNLAGVALLLRYGDRGFWHRRAADETPCRAGELLAGVLVSVPVIALLFVPVIALLFTALGLDAVLLVAVTVVLALLLLLPLLLMAIGGGRLAATLAGVTAAIVLGAGALTTRTSAEWPRHDNLFYARSLDDGSAVWGTRDRPDAWTAQFVGVARRGVPLACLADTGNAFYGPAPALAVSASDVRVTRNAFVGPTRQIELRVRAAPGAWWVLGPASTSPSARPVFLTEMGGLPVERREPFRLLTARGAPEEDLVIHLETASPAALAFTLVDSADGLPAHGMPGRPPGVVRGDEGRLFNDVSVTCRTLAVDAVASAAGR